MTKFSLKYFNLAADLLKQYAQTGDDNLSSVLIPLPVSNMRYEHGFSGSETRRSDES